MSVAPRTLIDLQETIAQEALSAVTVEISSSLSTDALESRGSTTNQETSMSIL